jgi:tetratricopeptide (TPR) repeat protein
VAGGIGDIPAANSAIVYSTGQYGILNTLCLIWYPLRELVTDEKLTKSATIMAYLKQTPPKILKKSLDFGRRIIPAKSRRRDLDSVRNSPEPTTKDKGVALYSTGVELLNAFQMTGCTKSLEDSVPLFRSALDHLSEGHELRAPIFADLGLALYFCSKHHTANHTALADSIQAQRQALELCSPSHPDFANNLNYLSAFLYEQFTQDGDIAVLVESVQLSRKVLEFRPIGHPDRADSLSNLANCLYKQFEKAGDTTSLDESIRLHREALCLRPSGHPDRAKLLGDLAISLHAYFMQTGDLAVLAESTRLFREALELRPYGHPDRALSLNNLAGSLHADFAPAGDAVALLAESIGLHREALELRQPGHPDRDISLTNLADSLRKHFDQMGDIFALDESITLLREALELRPPGHQDRVYTLVNLASSLLARFKETRDAAELAESIQLRREAVDLRPLGHPYRAPSLDNLAISLLEQFKITRDITALVESTRLKQEALDLRPHGHPLRIESLLSLTRSYMVDFIYHENQEALTQAFLLLKESFDARMEGDELPIDYQAHFLMADILLRESPHFNWKEAMNHALLGIGCVATPSRLRLQGTISLLELVEDATVLHPNEMLFSPEVLNIYESAIHLLPRVANLGLSSKIRLHELIGSEELCRVAATRAINLNRFEIAVELFEEGKTVFWQQALQPRSTGALSSLPLEDRDSLMSLLRTLEQNEDFSGVQDKAEIEARMEKRRLLNLTLEGLIDKIRTRPGYSRFLSVPDFKYLSRAAESGPIVILFKSEYFTCAEALVIANPTLVKRYAVKMVNEKYMRGLRFNISASGMRDLSNITIYDEPMRGMNVSRPGKKNPLAEIWLDIVKPLVEELGFQVSFLLASLMVSQLITTEKKAQGRARPRVHWYISGDFNFLPLHAAGIYEGENQECASDYIVSSYIPSLSALLRAREGAVPIPREELKAMLMAEPGNPEIGVPLIRGVEEEVQTVACLVQSASINVLNDTSTRASVFSVLDKLPDAHILHLACHGHQKEDPLQSCFTLNDGPLTISALMKLNLPNAMFAFLSACETAKGDRKHSDQVVHLAASLLFCGFRSIIATMW